MRLPAIHTTGGHVVAAVATVLVCAAMYFIPQHWRLALPVELPLTAVDRTVPFWPATGLIYFGAFVFLVATFLALPGRGQATRFLYASLLAQAVGMACFLLWPTQYPRHLYPLPASTGALGAALVHYVRATDAPVNCLPSLHVSTVTLCALALRGTRWSGIALVAALVFAASTLTFKQHYFVDVLAGAALGYLAWWICFVWRGFTLR
ncbi:MAG TPA: phosphatase PAP2 family protein [Steroidobacteraceae bacterium]|nr:phosphatase PAP2 family protein [Steroidobacteraceae bacterium]